jgi:hypothetical protein
MLVVVEELDLAAFMAVVAVGVELALLVQML